MRNNISKSTNMFVVGVPDVSSANDDDDANDDNTCVYILCRTNSTGNFILFFSLYARL